MKLTDLLKGKIVNVMTDARVVVQLEIKSVEEERHSRDLEPATISNDFWPPSENWTTIEVKFTNGYHKTYHSLSEIELAE
jgi:hypothetical protein